jgi:hypothetical protein
VAGRRRFWSLLDRSTADILILTITGTICASVLLYGLAVAILVFVQPEKDHSEAVTLLSDTFQLLIGLLAGFVAGRTADGQKARREQAQTDAEQDHE